MALPSQRYIVGLAALLLLALLAACTADYSQKAQYKAQYAAVYAKGRTLQEVQEGFDRGKQGIAAAYLTRQSLGPGRMVIGLTIAPDGTVSECHLVSSTFANPELESAILEQVKGLTFGARDVPTFTYPNYPIDFTPLQGGSGA